MLFYGFAAGVGPVLVGFWPVLGWSWSVFGRFGAGFGRFWACFGRFGTVVDRVFGTSGYSNLAPHSPCLRDDSLH